MKDIIFIISLLLPILSYALTSMDNISGQDQLSVLRRKAIIENTSNEGVRLAWDGMKEMNKEYKPGTVDLSIKDFEDEMVKKFNGKEFTQNNPSVDVKIIKTDFKGYYITCSPTPSCLSSVHDFMKKLPPGKLMEKGPDGKIIKKSDFNLISARAAHYEEGYIKARVLASYSDFDPPLYKFIDKELKKALKTASGKSNIKKINTKDPEFIKDLSRLIEITRSGKEIPKEEKHLNKFKPLVKALDNLLEKPFKSSNNLNKELSEALKAKVKVIPPAKYSVTSAISGDDLFVVIKDKDGKVLKVVGADARGLGVENMTARYHEVLNQYKNNKGINSLDDVLTLSGKATEKADLKMANSINQYVQKIKDAVSVPDVSESNILDILKDAHRDFHHETLTNPNLMQMRTTAIPNCMPKNQCILDNVTLVHNLLKKMEAKGIHGHFGDSCIGVKYWMKKMKMDF